MISSTLPQIVNITSVFSFCSQVLQDPKTRVLNISTKDVDLDVKVQFSVVFLVVFYSVLFLYT